MQRSMLQANDEKALVPISGVGKDGTVADTAGGVTLATFGLTLHKNACALLVSVKSNALNVTYDGSAPTAGAAGDGIQYAATERFWISRSMALTMKMIRAAGSDSEVRVEQFEIGSPVRG